MRGKVGFVLGAALGYVLGTRAGRARYEQIKRGAVAVWETPLVQQGVGSVKGAVGNRVDDVKAAASRAVKSAFVAATQPNRAPDATARPSQAAAPSATSQVKSPAATHEGATEETSA